MKRTLWIVLVCAALMAAGCQREVESPAPENIDTISTVDPGTQAVVVDTSDTTMTDTSMTATTATTATTTNP